MSEATYQIKPLTWVRDRSMLVAGPHYRIHPAEGDGPHYLEIDGFPNAVESIEAGKQLAWEDWQRRIGKELGVDPIVDNLRKQCEALVLEREEALARLAKVREAIVKHQSKTLGEGWFDDEDFHRELISLINN